MRRAPQPLVALDLDDTLFMEREYVYSGFEAVDRHLRGARALNGFLLVAGRLFDEGLRGRVFDVALAELGIDPSPALVRSLVARYRTHTPTITLLPDVSPFLAWAREKSVTAIVTDGYAAAQRRKLAALKVVPMVDHVVISDELGPECWKPNRAPFDRLRALSGCRPADSVYIGDNPGKDVAGPRRAGWRCLLLRRSAGEHSHEPLQAVRPDAVIASLGEAHAILESWWS